MTIRNEAVCWCTLLFSIFGLASRPDIVYNGGRKPERMTTVETEKEQQTPEKRTVCLQRADAEAFLAYRSVIARYAALLILLILVLAAALVAMRAHPSKAGTAAIVPAVLIPVAVFVSAVRKTETSHRQFAFFKSGSG